MQTIRFVLTGVVAGAAVLAADLPGTYYQRMGDGLDRVMTHLESAPQAGLRELESRPGWRHFPSILLVAAVLYAQDHPDNPRHGEKETLDTAVKIGDLLLRAAESGAYERLDRHRDTYMWLESFRLLRNQLDEDRRSRWRSALIEHIEPLAIEVEKRKDHPQYNSPYLITSPNHYSLWSSTLYLGGIVFERKEWENLGAYVMRRFATQEQSPDGYWGEHTRAGPTTGYDYLTSTGVALYWEHRRSGSHPCGCRRPSSPTSDTETAPVRRSSASRLPQTGSASPVYPARAHYRPGCRMISASGGWRLGAHSACSRRRYGSSAASTSRLLPAFGRCRRNWCNRVAGCRNARRASRCCSC